MIGSLTKLGLALVAGSVLAASCSTMPEGTPANDREAVQQCVETLLAGMPAQHGDVRQKVANVGIEVRETDTSGARRDAIDRLIDESLGASKRVDTLAPEVVDNAVERARLDKASAVLARDVRAALLAPLMNTASLPDYLIFSLIDSEPRGTDESGDGYLRLTLQMLSAGTGEVVSRSSALLR